MIKTTLVCFGALTVMGSSFHEPLTCIPVIEHHYSAPSAEATQRLEHIKKTFYKPHNAPIISSTETYAEKAVLLVEATPISTK
ncbi:MAG: hypothetical protein GOVbin630_17 [Prokaryotic dsDNA virus sp.]|nr:MAG: hypothetical protein GOVbin630_17 [Prokaryotic dsDNA virus sp.]|tara:strand:- start:11610 stop:11858 length:249 start_codon:yes stop_codon:yes gene_type:complete